MVLTTQERAITTTREQGHEIGVYLGPKRGWLDESAITTAWLPSPGAGWSDRTGAVLLSSGLTFGHDGRGYSLTFTVANESRTVYADDLAVALTARHWDGAAWSAWQLVMWGYLDGAGRQRQGLNLDQTGERTVTYAGYWDKLAVPAHRFGRPNLATGATVVASTPALATPAAEAPLEYVSQADCAASRLIDGNTDTVAVADVVADPALPALGDVDTPRITRAYAGRTVRTIGAGNEPLFVELGVGHNLTPWGDCESADAFPLGGDGLPSIADRGNQVTTLQTDSPHGGTSALRILARANANPNIGSGVVWEVHSPYVNVPMKLGYWIKAKDATMVGRTVHHRAASYSGQAYDYVVTLPSAWQYFEHVFDSSGAGGGAYLRWNADFWQQGTDLSWDLDDIRLSVGYSSNEYGQGLWFAYDNGAGGVKWINLGQLATPGGTDLRVPADDTIVVCDDVATFRAKFDPGGRTVLQLKNIAPDWFFGPGIGKFKIAHGANPNANGGGAQQYFQYDNVNMSTVDEFNPAALAWQPYQAMHRAAPALTGAYVVEDFPSTGLLGTAYGAAYWWLDLGAYKPTWLTYGVSATDTTLTVDDADEFPDPSQSPWLYECLRIGTERMLYFTKDGNRLGGLARGWGGTVAATHAAGDSVTPDLPFRSGDVGSAQTGWLVDLIELRRKPGTPVIADGAILTSNLLTPTDPSTSAARWERNADWQLWSRFAGNTSDVLSVPPPEGYRQIRHICVVIDRMARSADGAPQRAKLNEVVARKYVPGAGSGYSGHGAGTLSAVLAHLLTQHGQVPASKVTIAGSPLPIGDLPLTPTTVAQAITSLEGSGLLKVWLDPANVVWITPDPASPAFDGTQVTWTWDESNSVGELVATWSAAHAVSQAKVTAREVATLRTYSAAYPPRPATLGTVLEVNGIVVRNAGEARAVAEARYRAGNARRELTVHAGAVTWLRPYLRVLVEYPNLDLGGNMDGINCYVAGWSARLGLDAAGGVLWDCDVSLRELAL